MIKPTGAQVYYDCSWYKIGRFNLTYRHNGEEWVRSTKSNAQILKAIKDKEEEEMQEMLKCHF